MGISSSLNAGVSGLNANANKLATISDNIANSQTYGYKRADVDFSSLTVADAKSPNTVGGGRWFTAGGVKTNAIWDVDAKGALAQTTNATDLAITGRGFLPVSTTAAIGQTTAEMPFMLTTTGSFSTNAQGYLTTPSGLVLLGWPADANGVVASQPRDTVSGLEPVRVNLSSVAVQPTSNITLNVNLPTSDVEAGASGDPRVVTVEYFDNVGGSQTVTATFTPTVPATGDPRSNTWTLQLTDNATGQSAGTYEIVFSDAPPNAGGIASVTGPTGGTLATTYDPATGNMVLNLGSQEITIGLGSTSPTGPQHLSQLTSTFSSVGVSHDGAGAGTFTGLSIDEKGFLHATYSSGFSKVVYQIPVADVPNPNGLKVLDNQCFAISQASGSMFLWNAGDGPTGGIEGYAREQSTTDIANELTQLIQTQRAYSSNAKIIQTVDEMLQETTNLKR
ncbi:flagellar hook protein FlgE [Amaricoccus sp.]|uniref:flagellar hook protein FlgE n=1 Tax=Amaricoccus sp. TaxID=1872485 RepID=UPI0026345CBF|nr:flagellar hook-basal body complex protein [Amaricoccus sp.]HRO10325.1 flagellar hook-basal body complex protein [Amaricoccus sp.]